MKTLNKSKSYRVHPDDMDVRGWNFLAGDKKVGPVHDLVIDEGGSRVKYLDVMRQDRHNDRTFHYLIPTEEVSFDRNRKHVNFSRHSHDFIDSYPRYTDNVPADYEERVTDYYSRNTHAEKLHERYDSGVYKEGKPDQHEEISENWAEKINQLERQKQLRKLEYERDIAVLEKEIIVLKAKINESL